MRMKLAFIGVVLAALAAGCGEETTPGPGTPATTSTTVPDTTVPDTNVPDTTVPPDPTTPTTAVPATIDWSDPEAPVEAGDGWTVKACEGGGTLLCVYRGGAERGVVEALSFPLDSFEGHAPGDDPADTLDRIAADFLDSMESDRQAGCGEDYRFEPIPPAPFQLGGQPALSYGFAGARADGTPSELNLQYATVVDRHLVLVVAAAYDAGGCPGKDELLSFDSADLAEFRPNLERLLTASPLPDLPPEG